MDLRSKLRWDQATPVRITGVIVVIISMYLEVFIDARGYRCAGWTLIYCFSAPFELIPRHLSVFSYARQLRDVAFGIFLGGSGLINPLLLLYLFIKPTRRVLVLALFGVLLADGACVFVVLLHAAPGIGFYVWVAGIILILAPPYKFEQQSEPPFSITGGFEEPASRA